MKKYTQNIKNKYLKILVITNILIYAISLFSAPFILSIVAVLTALVTVWCIKKPVSNEEENETNDEE